MRRLATLTLILAAAGCSSDSATAPNRPVTAVSISPATTAAIVGQRVQLAVTVTGGFANPTITWTSSNAAVASVSDSGFVTAKTVGSVAISATTGGVTGTAGFTVTSGVTSVTVAPATSALIVGQAVQLTATTAGPLANPPLTWSSSNSSVASVSDIGNVVAKAAGTATITASAGGFSATATLTVTAGAVDRVSVCDLAVAGGCVASATLADTGTSVVARATAYNALGVDISSGCTFQWNPNVANVVTIANFGDATKRDALITRKKAGILSIVVTCNAVPGVFTISGPAAP